MMTKIHRPILINVAVLIVGVFLGGFVNQPLVRVETTSSYPSNNSNNDGTDSTDDPPISIFDIAPSVKEIVINVGSNLDPIMPAQTMGPCAHAIAIEPIVGCKIPSHPQLSVINAAVSSMVRFVSVSVLLNFNWLCFVVSYLIFSSMRAYNEKLT